MRSLARSALAAGLALAVVVCGEQGRFGGGGGVVGPGSDVTAPVASVVFAGGPADTIVDITDSLRFTARATDDTRVATLRVQLTGLTITLDTLLLDSTVTATQTEASRAFIIPLAANTAGQRLQIAVTATDAAGNTGTTTVNIRVDDPQPPALTVREPSSGVTVPAGGTLLVVPRAVDPSGIRRLGARLFFRNALNQPIAITGDSATYATPATTQVDTFNVAIPDTLNPGTYTVQTFAEDNSPNLNDTTSADITITVADTARPFGSFQAPAAASPLVAGDSVLVIFRAQDLTGVASLTLRGVSLRGNPALGTDTTVIRFSPKTATFTSQPSDTTISRYLNAVLTDSTPEAVSLEAIITDVGGNTATVTRSVTIVAGPFVQVSSPAGGSVQPVGTTVPIVIIGRDPDNVAILGFTATGSVTAVDTTTAITPPLAVTDTITRNLVIPATAPLGSVTITPFARDAAGNSFRGSPVTVSLVDTLRPTNTIIRPGVVDTQVTAGDSVLMRVRVQDNRGVSSVTLEGRSRRGVDSLGTGTSVTRFTPKTVALPQRTDTTFSRYLNAVATDSTTEFVQLVVTSLDSAGNSKSDSIRISVVAGPFVRVNTPVAGSSQPVGVPVSIAVQGFDPDSLTYLGFTASGVTAASDSVALAPLVVSSTQTLTLSTTAATPLGAETIVPFARDKIGNRYTGSPVTILFADTVRPTVTILQPATASFPVAAGDSAFVQVRVQDNRGVSRVVLTGTSLRGNASLGTDTTVTRYGSKTVDLSPNIDTTLTRYLLAVLTDSTSETASLIVTATDSSGNSSADTATVRIVSGPTMTINRPSNGSVTSVGKSIIIEVRGIDPNGVRILGWRASGVLTAQDSVIRAPVLGALADTSTFTDTLQIPALTPLGSITVVPFGVDSLDDPSGTVAGVSVDVQSAAGDVTPPSVSFVVASRVEVDDSVTVSASDASGMARVGFIVRALGSVAVVKGDSANFAGNLSDVTQRFQLALDTISTFPREVTVEGFAVDSVGNRATSAAETLTVVAGKTIALPSGGSIGDAIYNRNRNELLLTNTTLGQLEIFQLTDSTFASPIPVGSRPVGIALWPRDTTNAAGVFNSDTVVIANSGGTNLSVVDVSAARVERRRHRLPNYQVQTVKTATNAAGGVDIIITEFEFGDRPMYLGTTCGLVVGSGTGAARCDSVVAVYSTSPTPAQSAPFPSRGYVAWENLTSPTGAPSGHLFYEVAVGGVDTLQLISVRDTAPGLERRDTILGAGLGTRVTLTELAFQESTFVRNSGDFNHALIGEGGLDQGFARALTFDIRSGVRYDTAGALCTLVGASLKCDGQFDEGISGSIFMRDFVANRASRVTSIATNFNGRTNLVRADSIYAFDFTLRQTGLMGVGGTNSGMDFDPDNSFDAATRGTGGFGGTLNPNDRLVFAARPDANIDVFDTFFYQQVTTVPIRDPIIGPIRVAKLPSGVQLLVGVTSAGVVVVRLPNVANPFPAPLRPPVVSTR